MNKFSLKKIKIIRLIMIKKSAYSFKIIFLKRKYLWTKIKKLKNKKYKKK